VNLIEIALLGFAFALGCSVLGAWVGIQKDRSPLEGATLGFLFGPLGVLIELLLPTGRYAPERKRDPYQPTILSEAPDMPYLADISEPTIVPMRPEEAWLKELENRHRPKAL
jgi:hypothetical protein